MKLLPCKYPSCGERRTHHADSEDKPRGIQMIKVEDDYSENYPLFCSLSCAILDGWVGVKWQSHESDKKRMEAWYAMDEARRTK